MVRIPKPEGLEPSIALGGNPWTKKPKPPEWNLRKGPETPHTYINHDSFSIPELGDLYVYIKPTLPGLIFSLSQG
jgi:hypothetical protein